MTLIDRLLAQANKEANELSDLLNEAAQSLAQPKQEVAALFREALAFGLAYGPEIPRHQWDEMREEKVAQLVSRLAAPPAKTHQEPVGMTFDDAYASLSWEDWRMRPVKELLAELHRLTSQPARKPLTDVPPELFAQRIEAEMRYAYTPLSHDQFVTPHTTKLGEPHDGF